MFKSDLIPHNEKLLYFYYLIGTHYVYFYLVEVTILGRNQQGCHFLPFKLYIFLIRFESFFWKFLLLVVYK